jgi:hypothetical protein
MRLRQLEGVMMDCTTAQGRLDALRPDSDAELRTPEWADVAAHLSDCAECQSALHRHRDFDRQFARALRDVPVPEQGMAQLRRQLGLGAGVASEAPAEPPRAAVEKQPRSRRRFLAWSLSAAAALLLVLSGLWWTFSGPPPIDLSAVIAQATADKSDMSAAPAFANSFTPTLPTEISVPRAGAPRSLVDPRNGREIGAVYSFPITWRQKRVEVRLVVLETRRIAPTDLAAIAPKFLTAEPRYVDGVAAKVWREDDRVYLCFVRTKGADALESLRSVPMAT